MYELPLGNGEKGNSSGICYHLKNEDVDWAVKLYYEKPCDEKFYPTLGELKVLGEIHEQVIPVIVSEYPVFDSGGDYIGCVAPFIYEPRGKTKEILYQEPLENVLNGLHKIQETIPTFTKYKVVVNDWAIWNMKIGVTKNLEMGMYLFDDSFYEISDASSETIEEWNQMELSYLIFTMIEQYFVDVEYESMTQKEFCSRFEEKNSLRLLEQESRGYSNLESYLESAKEKNYRMN